MDLWVVGAATAAGYIAKYWQKVSRDGDSLSDSVPSNCRNNETSDCPFARLCQIKKPVENTSSGERLMDMYDLDAASEAEVSTSGYVEKLGSSENDEHNLLSLSSLSPGLSRNDNLEENGNGKELSGDKDDFSGQMDSFHDYKRKKSCPRSKHTYGQFIKPLSSLESCLMAQLYKEDRKMEEHLFSVFPSPSATMRPLLVTDGNQTINRANGDYFSGLICTEYGSLYMEEKVCGVLPLPKISALDIPNKIKSKKQKGKIDGIHKSLKAASRRHFHSQNGSRDQMILFCLGVCVGIVSSLLASRREVDELKDSLKQSENLVQDLQEELEMKNSLTMKELADENFESQDTCKNFLHDRTPNPLLPAQDVDNLNNNFGEESHYEKAKDTSEDMSKIEAELEAELERLELNINTSSLEGRLSELVELDPDFVADFAEGELRTDMANGRSVARNESDQDASGTATTHTGNYAVSPRELSLRLHEVIESRLEERVKKLKTALENSERKLQLMESEQKNVQEKLPNHKLRYSSGEESPIAIEDYNSMAQPLVMNLSGEALDAYSEAYEELMKIDESEEDDSPSGIYENNYKGGINPFTESILWGRKGSENDSSTHLSDNKEKYSRESYFNKLKASIEHVRGMQELLYDGDSEGENREIEQQLIKQIVEKTRKGSPAVLNAQRVLFSMDEDEY